MFVSKCYEITLIFFCFSKGRPAEGYPITPRDEESRLTGLGGFSETQSQYTNSHYGDDSENEVDDEGMSLSSYGRKKSIHSPRVPNRVNQVFNSMKPIGIYNERPSSYKFNYRRRSTTLGQKGKDGTLRE